MISVSGLDVKKIIAPVIKRIVFSTALVCCLSACGIGPKDGSRVLHVDIDSALEEQVSVFDICSKIEIIPLSTDAMISNGMYSAPQSLVVCEDNLFILDDKSQNIVCFSTLGEYVKTFNKRGRGHGEYTMAYGMTEDPGEVLSILDPTGRIFRYSINDSLTFLDVKRIKGLKAIHIMSDLVDGHRALYSYSEDNLLSILDDKGKAQPVTYHIDKRIKNRHFSRNPFFLYNSSLFVFDSIDGSSYEVDCTSHTVFPRYKWDLGKYKTKVHHIARQKKEDFYEYLKTQSYNRVYPFLSIMSYGDKIYAEVILHNTEYMIVYDLETNKSSFFCETLEHVHFKPGVLRGNEMYLLVEPQYLSRFVNEKVVDKENMKRLSTVSDSSNVVLIKYSML